MNALVHHCLLEQYEAMLSHEPHALEGLDAEGVHQMRVAIRRMRSALRAFKRLLPTKPPRCFRKDFQWLAAALGSVRDLDVYEGNFQRNAAEILADDVQYLKAYHHHLEAERQKMQQSLFACLTSQRYLQLKEEFTQFLLRGADEISRPSAHPLTIGKAATQLIGKRYKRLLRDGRAIKRDSTEQTLHALRIDCKRLRYLLEFFQPAYGKSLNPDIRRLTKLQDVLGEFHDACVAIRRLREYANRVPIQKQNREELIALGQLSRFHQSLATDLRSTFRENWKRFDRKGQRKRIVAMLK